MNGKWQKPAVKLIITDTFSFVVGAHELHEINAAHWTFQFTETAW